MQPMFLKRYIKHNRTLQFRLHAITQSLVEKGLPVSTCHISRGTAINNFVKTNIYSTAITAPANARFTIVVNAIALRPTSVLSVALVVTCLHQIYYIDGSIEQR